MSAEPGATPTLKLAAALSKIAPQEKDVPLAQEVRVPPPARSLVDVLARVAVEDRAAFDALYHATSAKLYGVIFRILRNRPMADEVLQEVYVRIWRRAGEFDATRGSPIAWMATIARNRALDEVRRRSATPMEDIGDAPDPADEGAHPLDKRERLERLRALLRCLDGLDPIRRRVVLGAYYHGASRQELSEQFGAPVATVKSWLRRSLMQLKTCLDA